MTPGVGVEPGKHWWESSALTTAPSLLSIVNYRFSQVTSRFESLELIKFKFFKKKLRKYKIGCTTARS